MFTFDSVVDTYVKNTKAVLAYIQPEGVKTALISATDKQAEFTKGFARHLETSAEYLTKSVQEIFKLDSKIK